MKTNKLWWSLLVALMLPLSFALTACSDDDDDKDGGSDKLANTAWMCDAGARDFAVIFYEDEFDAYSTDGYYHYSGEYQVTDSRIKISHISGSDDYLESGSYKYEMTGSKGQRELIMYDVFYGGEKGDLYLEEVEVPDEMWE